MVGLCGCTTFDNFKAAFFDKKTEDKSIIRIGVLEPVTGGESVAAEDEIRGIQLANEVYPNVNGKIVELVFADNKSDIYATQTAVETLIAKEPVAILGSYGSVYSLAAANYIEEAKIPTFAATNTNPLVTRNYNYYFRVCYVDANQGDLLAVYVLEDRKEKTAGVLLPASDDAAAAMATTFIDRMKAETGDADAVPVYEKYDVGDTDFTKQLRTIKRSGVKSVLLPGNIDDAINIINQAAQMGLDVQFLGETEWAGEDFEKALNANVVSENIAFVQFFAADGKAATTTVSKQRQQFLDAYFEKHGRDGGDPSDAVALGYDSYCVALDAIDKAPDDATGEEIIDVLNAAGYSFDGATGTIHFGITGDPVKTAYITTWNEGKMATVYTIDPIKK